GGGARLAEEPLPRLGQPQRLGQEELHGDPLPERRVLGGDHDAHAALPDHLQEPVLSSDQRPLGGDAVWAGSKHETRLQEGAGGRLLFSPRRRRAYPRRMRLDPLRLLAGAGTILALAHCSLASMPTSTASSSSGSGGS